MLMSFFLFSTLLQVIRWSDRQDGERGKLVMRKVLNRSCSGCFDVMNAELISSSSCSLLGPFSCRG